MSKGFFNLLHTKIGIYHGPVRDVEISPRVLVKWYVTAKLRPRTPRSVTMTRMRIASRYSLATQPGVCYRYLRLHVLVTRHKHMWYEAQPQCAFRRRSTRRAQQTRRNTSHSGES